VVANRGGKGGVGALRYDPTHGVQLDERLQVRKQRAHDDEEHEAACT
jgi:hypothetical protein